MGKPKKVDTRNSSATSLRSCRRMSSCKLVNANRRIMTKKNKKIKRLFEQLRASHSVINLDDTNEPVSKKRKCSPSLDESIKAKVKKMSNSGIIIIPDDQPTNSTPQKTRSAMMHSTPLVGTSKNLSDLNLSVINNSKNNNHMAENFNREVTNLTADIETGIPAEYKTVDLTGEVDPTVIDLNVTTDSDVILVTSNTSINSSCDSQVTVVERPQNTVTNERKIRRVAKGLNGLIANMDSSSQGKLLEMIAANIFNGCKVIQPQATRASHQTPEDIYIKEMLQGERPSNSSIGSNIYDPDKRVKRTGPRTVVIDGSNVAMEHSRGKDFSVKGLKICIDYFVNRGHEVRAFVPRFRCKFGKSTEPRLLDALERSGVVVYTPSREVHGRNITSYDDRYIVQYASAVDGVIVSGDNYRDLAAENPRWRRTIEQRVLPFTWVQDLIMFPRDPLGRNGPTLEQFLRHDN